MAQGSMVAPGMFFLLTFAAPNLHIEKPGKPSKPLWLTKKDGYYD